MKCANCGQDNAGTARFCFKCGASLKEGDTVTLTPSVQPAQASSVAPLAGKPIPSTAIPSTKPVTPAAGPVAPSPVFGATVRVPSPGMCYYHQSLRATYVCCRCGRQVCKDCAKAYVDLVFCPPCYTTSMP